MSKQKTHTDKQKIVHTPEQIAFGFDRLTDESSLLVFLRALSSRKLLDVLIPRLNDVEISETVAYVTGLMKKHLSEEEYHRLFLKDEQE